MSPVRIRDLVGVRPIRTVIHLDDPRDPTRRDEVQRCFVPTPEAVQVLRTVFSRMARGAGEGVFLQGPYGSGKSHLLTYLGLAASDETARESLAGEPGVTAILADVAAGSWLVASLPLVDHPARLALETLVTGSISRALADRNMISPGPEPEGRQGWMDSLLGALWAGGLRGVLLLVDELSEFLRAKPDARSFAEDIRFLQFLGERAESIPMVVVAGLQEGVEETGPIAPDAFQKIKDRYPGRFVLTAGHVGELVRQRILAPCPGSRAQVESIHRRLRACLPHWKVDAETFANLYPVHPETLQFLEQLKPLFSQHRGVVEFLVTRLAGSVERGVPPLIDAPAGTLLTADAILDHFRQRLKERMETAPLVDEVLSWWDGNLPATFPQEDERTLASRALKVLALASLFPYEKPITARQMAQILVVSVTDLEPSLNDHLTADVLDRMVSRGAYIVSQPGPEGDPLGRTYLLRRSADAALLAKARVREVAAGLAGRTEEILAAVTAAVDEDQLPLRQLAAQRRVRRAVGWQSTTREGWVVLGDPWSLPAPERDGMEREVGMSETDFFFFIVPPTIEATTPPTAAGPTTLPPELAALPLLVWVPRPLDDLEFLTEARARQLAVKKLEADPIPRAAEILKVLSPVLEDDRRHLVEIVLKSYFGGSIVGPSGPIDGALTGGLPTLDRLLERAVGSLLGQRYPRHFTVAPTGAMLGRSRLSELVESFLRSGSVATPQAVGGSVRQLLEGYLKTQSLAGRAGGGWQLRVDLARSETAGQLLESLGDDPMGIEDLYWRLRKGPLGLTR
ncbi:MAG: hypothetical protein HY815_16650, partial [Candidatus Riflebacteria bacterium]|nr:hypothetical protein [Candidatus Riflebacteria bacterium]